MPIARRTSTTAPAPRLTAVDVRKGDLALGLPAVQVTPLYTSQEIARIKGLDHLPIHEKVAVTVKHPQDSEVDQKIYRTAVEAARKKFSPEFMNRIDKVVVFRSLKEHHLRQILDLELQAVQDRIMKSAGTKFVFQCSDAAKDFLLEEGIDFKYGARHLKRAIERFLVYPLSNLVATEQVGLGDLVYVDISESGKKLTFSKRSGGALTLRSPAPRGERSGPIRSNCLAPSISASR